MGFSPTLGRWLETDPSGYVDGVNLFEFERSNPVARTDPLGLESWTNMQSFNSMVQAYQRGDAPQPYSPAPNRTARGEDLFHDFERGQGPRNRAFRSGDRLTLTMANMPYVNKQRDRAINAAMNYCTQGGKGPLPKSGKFESRKKGAGNPDNVEGIENLIRDVASILSQGDSGWIGSFTGGWAVIKVDCCEKCATVSWRLNNRMSMRSAMYNVGPDLTRAGSYQSITQSWAWHDRVCWGDGGRNSTMLP